MNIGYLDLGVFLEPDIGRENFAVDPFCREGWVHGGVIGAVMEIISGWVLRERLSYDFTY